MIKCCLRRFVWGIMVIACLALPLIQVSSALGQEEDPYKTHKQLNPARFSMSRQVIQGYLSELYTNLDFALKPGNEPAAEYLSQNVIRYHVYGPTDPIPRDVVFPNDGTAFIRDPLVLQEIDTAYQVFSRKVITIFLQFNSKALTLQPRRDVAPMSADFTDLLYSEMRYKSPFISGDPNESDSRAWYNAIVLHNASHVSALKDYIKEIENIYKKIVSRTNISRIDNDTLDILDGLAMFLYNTTTRVRLFQLNWAMQQYARASAVYYAYTNFYNRCWDQYYSFYAYQEGFLIPVRYRTHPSDFFFEFTRYKYTRFMQRTGWTTCQYWIDTTSFYWTPEQGWGAEAHEPPIGDDDIFASAVGVPFTCWNGLIGTPKGRYDINAITSKVMTDIAEIYSINAENEPIRYSKRDAAADIAAIQAEMLPAVCSYFESYNQYYDASKQAVEQLKDTVNPIIFKYKSYLPYARPYSLVGERLAQIEDGGDDPGASTTPYTTYYWCPYLDFELAQDTMFSVAASNDGPKTLPASFSLTSTLTDFPPDGGAAQYRWVITRIPQSSKARSPRYVMGQVISTGPTAVLDLRGIVKDPEDPLRRRIIDDLASSPEYGNWEVTLEVNNNRPNFDTNRSYTAPTEIQANRIILAIQHNDRDIALEETSGTYPYYGNINISEPFGPFYLEVAHDKAGVYANYDDDDCPVDPRSFTADASDGAVFTLRRQPGYRPPIVPGHPSYTKGIYDGDYNSTNLTNAAQPLRSGLTDNLTLASAASIDEDSDLPCPSLFLHKVPIEVEVIDNKITELFLKNTNECMTVVEPPPGLIYRRDFVAAKPKKIPRAQFSTQDRSYIISQWVNLKQWVNPGRNGFVAVDSPKYITPDQCVPDWLERRAAEALKQGFPESLVYVDRIYVSAQRGGLGHTVPMYSDSIWLNPLHHCMRYNKESRYSAYGFTDNHANDGIARHEAFHVFYYDTVIAGPFPWQQGIYPDLDKDTLPGATAGGRFKYLYDSDANFAGGYGPKRLQDNNYPLFTYVGDDKDWGFDIGKGTIKRAVYRINCQVGSITLDPNTLPQGEIEVPLMSFIPYDYISVNAYLVGRKMLGDKEYTAEANVRGQAQERGFTPLPGYGFEFKDPYWSPLQRGHLDRTVPGIHLHAFFKNPNVWVAARDGLQNNGYTVDNSIYLEYSITCPILIQDLDASLSEPGRYNGAWESDLEHYAPTS